MLAGLGALFGSSSPSTNASISHNAASSYIATTAAGPAFPGLTNTLTAVSGDVTRAAKHATNIRTVTHTHKPRPRPHHTHKPPVAHTSASVGPAQSTARATTNYTPTEQPSQPTSSSAGSSTGSSSDQTASSSSGSSSGSSTSSSGGSSGAFGQGGTLGPGHSPTS